MEIFNLFSFYWLKTAGRRKTLETKGQLHFLPPAFPDNVYQTRIKPGAALQTPVSLIHSLIQSLFVKNILTALPTILVENGAFSHKI